MSLADFFERTAQSILQVKGGTLLALEECVTSVQVAVCFDDAALQHPNTPLTLDLAVNLLVRLYPKLGIQYLGTGDDGRRLEDDLRLRACEINPALEFSDPSTRFDYAISLGDATPSTRLTTWVSSDSWNVQVSRVLSSSCGRGSAYNPFSAAIAACLGVAEVFSGVFGLASPLGELDLVSFSVLDYRRTLSPSTELPPVHLPDVVLVGLGAVGNPVVWCLSKLHALSGRIDLVDHETVDLSNLQRYVLTDRQALGAVKADYAKVYLQRKDLEVSSYREKFADYVARHRSDCQFSVIATAVDNAEDRIAAQATLPALVLNGWTGEAGTLGVSRHRFDEKQACLACLYLSTQERKSRAQEIADVTGLGLEESLHLLLNRVPLSKEILMAISEKQGYPLELLLQWEGKTIDNFYVEAVCGVALLQLGLGTRQKRDTIVPLAHQSALAGAVLAAEIVKDALGLVPPGAPVEARLSVLSPFPDYVATPRGKTTRPKCICQDKDYLEVHRRKHRVSQQPPLVSQR